MRTSWKLGRIAGIDTYVHPTFLFVLFLPPVAQRGAEGLLLVLAAFGCVVLHELGHALAARQFGIATSDITLYPIGGVARLSRMPRTPVAELVVALAGPAVNVALALGLGLLSVLGVLGWDTVMGSLGMSLIGVNVVLAAFNMLPAFPMDGGRVFRALLSGWLGRARATSIAAGVGQFLAVLFGTYSLIQGQWFQVALAGFLYVAAGAERNQVVAEEDQDRYQGGPRHLWEAPLGYRWERRGEGRWQLAPVFGTVRNGPPPRWR